MESNGKNYLIPSDFDSCPAWKYDEDSDLFYPVRREEDLPELTRDLSVRAVFTAPTGETLDGYVVGIDRIFSMGLFEGNRIYHVNKHLPGPSREQIKEYLATKNTTSHLTFESMFPLQFKTDWEDETFINFSGIFDIS